MCGGVGSAKPVTDDVRSLCETLKSDLESRSGRTFSIFNPVEVASQVVAGTNYFVKIDVGEGEYVHVRIFQPLACNGTEPSLHNFQLGKAKDDKLEHF